MNHRPLISFVLATHNRRTVVAETLTHVKNCGLVASDYEIVVVDNASTDGTPDAIADDVDCLVRLDHNAGSCGKSFGIERARGEFVVFLDDDSYPRPGSTARMLVHFLSDARLGAAGFTVHLPDGRLEGAALPYVFVGCGAGFRTEALRDAGGLDGSFFMQAEEYDLTFRIAARGWTVKTFADLHVAHRKTSQARRSERTTFYDIRNNLRVAARYLPAWAAQQYRQDWAMRYRWLADTPAERLAFARGARAGRDLGFVERCTYGNRRLPPHVFERFFQWDYLESKMRSLSARRVVFADLGKNVYAYHRAARAAGIDVLAIGDDRFSRSGRAYRGTPILTLSDALALPADAIVIANSSEVHSGTTHSRLSELGCTDICNWTVPPAILKCAEMDSAKVARSTDDILAGHRATARERPAPHLYTGKDSSCLDLH